MNSKKFDALHQGIPSADLRVERKQIKEGKNEAHGYSLTDEDRKREINGITSILTEQAWAEARKWIDTHPGRIVYRKESWENDLNEMPLKLKVEFLKVNDEEYLAQLPTETQNQYGEELDNIAYASVEEAMKTWRVRIESMKTDDPQYSLIERYKLLLDIRNEKPKKPGIEINRGLGTACKTIAFCISVIPDTYMKKFGRTIREKEYSIIARNIIPLVINIAQTHLDVFGELQEKYSTSSHPDTGLNTMYVNKDVFDVAGSEQSLRLELADTVFEEMAKKPASVEINVRTQCPAIFSQGTKGKNVIAELHEYILDLNRRLFLPRLINQGIVKA